MDLDLFLSDHVRSSTQHRCFYHFTDRRNLASIQTHGLLSLAECRARGILIAAPGGNQWSCEADEIRGLDRYVHLCFTPDHPMKYICETDGRIAQSVLLRIRPEVVKRPGVLLTAEVANKSGVIAQPPERILDELDLEVLYRRTDWKASEIRDRLQIARKYEILIPDQVLVQDIVNPNG